MNRNPKVSVIMSVYNGEKYLREAIDSILNQTFTDFEFIIINDGSKDKTKEISESYNDPRIRLFHQDNIGLTKSLNKALSFAKSEYIARQDADDISLPERLEKEVDILENNKDIGMVGTYAVFINESSRAFNIWKMPIQDNQIRKRLMIGNSFCHGSVMFRKQCINNIGTYRENYKYTQDYDFWLRIADHYKLYNIGEELYKFRRHSKAISRRKLSEQLNYHLLAIELAKERKEKGFDSYVQFKDSNIIKFLTDYFSIRKSEINKFKAKFFFQYHEEAFRLNDYFGSTILFLKAFMYDPFNIRIRDVIFYKSISKLLKSQFDKYITWRFKT